MHLLLILACATKDPSDSDTRDWRCPEGWIWLGQECGPAEPDTARPTDSDFRDCYGEIRETSPRDGATDAYYRGPVEFRLSDHDPSAELRVEGVPGRSGFDADDPELVRFTPDAPFEPSTAYTATLDYCGGQEASIGFTTSSTGSPVPSAELAGRSWVVDLQSGRVVEPAGAGAVVENYLDVGLLIGVSAADDDRLTLLLAPESTDRRGLQDLCAPTSELIVDYSEDPSFSFGPQDASLPLGGGSLALQDMVLEGSVRPDGEGLQGVTLSGVWDTRPYVDLVEEGGEPGALCDIAAGFGVRCEPCASDGGTYCVTLRFVDLTAEPASAEVLEVTGDCHETCQDEAGQCPQGCASVGGAASRWLALLGALALLRRRRLSSRAC
ncbi:MAG: hypothetical protein H6741_21390 [Alphaproteobacteria bacterium]|nr:hypothetical protein [Alphaproteobacteria bacterium]